MVKPLELTVDVFDELVRVLTRSGIPMQEAAEELGMSRATVYRKIAQYDIHVPRAGS